MAAMYDSDGNYIGDDGSDNNAVDQGPPAPPAAPTPPTFDSSGGTGDGVDAGNTGALDTSPPSASDVASYRAQLIAQGMSPAQADAQVNQTLANVAAYNPSWAGAVQALAPGVKLPAPNNGATTGGPTGTNSVSGTPPLSTSGVPTAPGTTTTPGTTNSLGTVAGGLVNAITDLGQSQDYKTWAQQAAALADPFASQRGQYQTDLSNLYADPSSVQNTPGYQFALQQGLGATANRDNNKFGLGAGSTSVDMQNYAQGLASQTYNSTVGQLEQLSGANTASPGTAATAYASGMNASALAQTGAMGALSPLFQAAATPVTNPGTTPTLPANPTVNDLNSHVTAPPPDPGTITNNQNVPSAPVSTNPTVTNDIGSTVPNNNTGVQPGGT